MVRVHIEETIHRPIEEVFERLVDISKYSEWMPKRGLFIASTKDSEGPVGLGTLYSDRTWLGTVRGEVISFERPNRVVFQYTLRLLGALVMQGRPGYALESDGGGGTIVHHTAEGRLYGPFKLMRPVVQFIARGERQRTVDALKESLESSSRS